MPQAIYLDSQCMAYLLGQPVLDSKGWTAARTRALGDAVDRAIGDGTVVLYGSHFHLEEASRISHDDARRRFMDFFWCKVKWNVLLPTQELAVAEAQLRRALEGTEPFEEFWRRQDLRRVSRSKSDLDGLAAGVKAFVDNSVADSAARRASATQKLEAAYAKLTPAEVSKRWWKDADATIEDWVKDYIASSKEHLGLGDDAAEWPKPRDMQTAWAMHAYMMARIVMNIGFNRKIGDGDGHDAHHYASACYADVFVTEDGAFRNILDIIPNSPVTVLSFDELAAQFGITQA